MDGLLIVMSGFSGAGKGTILKRLLEDYEDFTFSVSMTTRKPRPGEVDGKDYFFVTKERFLEEIQKNGLVEHAEYCDNYYGTPRAYVETQLKQGKSVVLDIEVQGALQVMEKFPDALTVFITPPDTKIWLERLRGRGTENEEVIQKRVAQAKREVNFIDRYQYLIVNDDLDAAVRQMHDLVDAQKLAVRNRKDFTDKICEELKNL